MFGLNKLLEARKKLISSNARLAAKKLLLRKEIAGLVTRKEEFESYMRRLWGERDNHFEYEAEHYESLERLKKEKEEIIESLTNLDGFRGIKTLVNNMVQQDAIAKQKGESRNDK